MSSVAPAGGNGPEHRHRRWDHGDVPAGQSLRCGARALREAHCQAGGRHGPHRCERGRKYGWNRVHRRRDHRARHLRRNRGSGKRGGAWTGILRPQAHATATRPVDAQPAPAPWTGELVVASLGEIVHARSGDKGGDANLGVWVRDRQAWDWLKSTLTVDELRRLLPETRELAISRYELPNLGAVNFVVRGLLGTGATSALRLDAQAKALGEWLRSRTTKVPRSLVKT